jgi:uncharacterized Fe-S cluster protein YjdI
MVTPPDIEKHYTNGDLTVVWKPKLCIHSRKCWEGTPSVFDPDKRPWVNIKGAASAEIAAQVRCCPSGALSLLGDPPSRLARRIGSTSVVESRRLGAGAHRASHAATVTIF